MSNQVDHRKTKSKRNKRKKNHYPPAHTCAGEGHNGAIGRAKWKNLTRRRDRRRANREIELE